MCARIFSLGSFPRTPLGSGVLGRSRAQINPHIPVEARTLSGRTCTPCSGDLGSNKAGRSTGVYIYIYIHTDIYIYIYRYMYIFTYIEWLSLGCEDWSLGLGD